MRGRLPGPRAAPPFASPPAGPVRNRPPAPAAGSPSPRPPHRPGAARNRRRARPAEPWAHARARRTEPTPGSPRGRAAPGLVAPLAARLFSDSCRGHGRTREPLAHLPQPARHLRVLGGRTGLDLALVV